MNGSMHEKIINSFINSMKNLGHLMKNSIIYFVAAYSLYSCNNHNSIFN